MKPEALVSDSSNSKHWFVSPQANAAAQTRLFLFPYAGGGPAVFGKWPEELPRNLDIQIAHYPGRGSRHHEPAMNRVSSLVGGLSQAIQPLLDRPFVFFGHSLGALLAFELARHLRQQDLPQPTILFVSAYGAPHLPDPHPPIHALPNMEFLKALEQLNGIPSELLRIPDAVELLLPILRNDFEAIESYHYVHNESPLNCPLVAFGGLNDPRVRPERLEGWASHTNSYFKSQYFPGDHFFINTATKSIIASITAEIIF